MKLETLRTIAFDIRHSVFENKTEAIMYITNDIHSDSFIIAIPVISFSVDIVDGQEKQDYDWIKSHAPIGDPVQKEKLIDEIKKAIIEFE